MDYITGKSLTAVMHTETQGNYNTYILKISVTWRPYIQKLHIISLEKSSNFLSKPFQKEELMSREWKKGEVTFQQFIDGVGRCQWDIEERGVKIG